MPWVDRADLTEGTDIRPQKATKSLVEGLQPAQPAFNDWMDEGVDRFREHAPEARDTLQDQIDMQVFISEGMPEGVLRHLFSQAWEEKPGTIRFVLRGFTPQQLGPLIGRLRKLFPNPEGDRIIVEIDPGAFRQYGVDAVPVFLVKDKAQGRWYEVQGAISLQGAREHVARQGSLVAGERYPITEPDILAVIEERARNYDWKPALERAQSRVSQNLSPSFDLPAVTHTATEFFDPVFNVPHDIVIPQYNGEPERVIARAGETYRVLDFTRLQVPIIVFDAADRRQMALVKSWLATDELRNADLFIVGDSALPGDRPAAVALSEMFQRPVYPWFGRMTDRFGVRAVPAIVDQSGDRLRIRYVEPRAP